MRVPYFRWLIAILLAAATLNAYLDRQAFPVLVSEMRNEIPISNREFALLNSLFLFAYATMYAGGGWLMDRLGTRLGFTVTMLWWSAASMLTGTANSVRELGFYRFMLGVGEGGAFPGCGKAVAEWFRPSERAMAFGIFNTGSAVGAVLAPPLLALIAWKLDWRWAFYISGALGIAWVMAWLLFYDRPQRSRWITPGERLYLTGQDDPEGAVPDPGPRIPWLRLFAYRQVWGLMTAKFLSDAAWYFYIFWLPKYLVDTRGLNIAEIGTYAWIPYAFMGGGSLIGGWLSSYLIYRGVVLDRARKIALATGAFLVPAALFVVFSPLALALFVFGIAFFGHQFYSSNVQTLAADIFPPASVGSVEGLVGMAGSFGGVIFGLIVGVMVDEIGYTLPFMIAGVLHPISFVALLLLVRRIEPMALPGWRAPTGITAEV
jgi:MFS transporter, ACS family, hexuronate transporter